MQYTTKKIKGEMAQGRIASYETNKKELVSNRPFDIVTFGCHPNKPSETTSQNQLFFLILKVEMVVQGSLASFFGRA